MPPPRDLVRRLYEEPPDRFVATRDAAVAEARRAGDPATAREIARLRRPTVAAWLVNLLAIRCPELVADLGQLAEALRVAQRDLRGPRLRELSAQRRAVVAALVAEVRRLAADAEGGPPGGKLPLAEVEATLNAALSDTEVAEQVRTGRLLRAASYAGFGEVPRPQLRLVTGDEEPAPAAPDRAAGRDRTRRERDERAADRAARAERVRQRRALERELAKARTDQGRAEAELAGAADAEHGGAEELADIERSLAELERRRAEAEQELSRRRLARRAAERAATAARRRTGEVEGAIEAIDAEEGTAAGSDGGGD
ncbi:hypothetical protein C5N14_24395 [Micromonospora sp. MW-13]|uniref:hypothetical protein n=1 Tax=unclassified Micromonospora TaxID=2617518 RepID=UPI000E447EB6|nr:MULTISPECIES: hypothetical protein [unclassified Micromonospora]MCX4474408.1 hypothetical protein [Micromonospora sp. NBC_01655]RGC66260.1 hypothetical protein C5N14_24395 [Micromonospora sp. MW-13]